MDVTDAHKNVNSNGLFLGVGYDGGGNQGRLQRGGVAGAEP